MCFVKLCLNNSDRVGSGPAFWDRLPHMANSGTNIPHTIHVFPTARFQCFFPYPIQELQTKDYSKELTRARFCKNWKKRQKNSAATFYTQTSQMEGLPAIKRLASQTDCCSFLEKTLPSIPEELEWLGGVCNQATGFGCIGMSFASDTDTLNNPKEALFSAGNIPLLNAQCTQRRCK